MYVLKEGCDKNLPYSYFLGKQTEILSDYVLSRTWCRSGAWNMSNYQGLQIQLRGIQE